MDLLVPQTGILFWTILSLLLLVFAGWFMYAFLRFMKTRVKQQQQQQREK